MGITEERMRAALWSLACGDALGQLTEGYWPQDIEGLYGGPIQDFRPLRRSRGGGVERLGQVSDDTIMTLLLAQSLVAHQGRFDADDFAERIARQPIPGWPRWQAFVRARAAGDWRAATDSAGSGAAVRAVVVGLINRPDDLDLLVLEAAATACVTHRRPEAVAAAAATAAAVAAAVEGAAADEVLDVAAEAAVRVPPRPCAPEGEQGDVARSEGSHGGASGAAGAPTTPTGPGDAGPRARPPAGDDVIGVPGAAIAHALDTLRLTLAGRNGRFTAEGQLGAILSSRWEPGFQAVQAVPFALVLGCVAGDARRAILEAVNQGGDADTVAALAGAVAGALAPTTLPAPWVERVREANPHLDIDPLVRELARLR